MAEDLVQDAFLAASSRETDSRAVRMSAPGSCPSSGIKSWTIIAASHVPRRPLNRMRPASPDPVIDRYFSGKGFWKNALASWKAPEQALEDREFWDVLERCLGRLPRSLSAVFILREPEEVDNAELRRILAVSEANLRVRLHRVRLLLRECLEKHWFGETRDSSKGKPMSRLNGLVHILTLHCEAASELMLRAGRIATASRPGGARLSPPGVQILPAIPRRSS